MNILFLSLSSVYNSFYGGLAKMFSKKGHSVTMISPSPTRDSDTVVEGVRNITFKFLPLSGTNMIKKGIANLLFPFCSKRVVKRYSKQNTFDLILSSTPPVAFFAPIKYIKKHNKQTKHYLILRDIWPEAFNLFNIEKHHPIVYSFFRRQERILYSVSDIIGCMSEGNIDFVRKSNPETEKKLRLLYNWGVETSPVSTTSDVRQKYDLEGKFVLIYGGNMGIPQGLDNILKLASMVKDKTDVVFLLIGRGEDKERIRGEVNRLDLKNVRIMNFLPKTDFESILHISDVGLISLNEKLKTPSIPSKTISYWSLRMPIMAIVDRVTDYGPNIIDKSQSGLWAYADDDERILYNFEQLYSDKALRSKLGDNGLRFLVDECSEEKAYNTIMSQLYE